MDPKRHRKLTGVLVSGNRTAPVRKSDGSGLEIRRQPSGNRPVPSLTPPPNHPNTNSDGVDVDSVQGDGTLTETQRQVEAELKQCGVHGPKLAELSRKPNVTVPRIRRVSRDAQGKRNPAGYLVSVLETEGGGCEHVVKNTTKAWRDAIKNGEVAELPNGLAVTGYTAKYNGDGLYLSDSDGRERQVAAAKKLRDSKMA